MDEQTQQQLHLIALALADCHCCSLYRVYSCLKTHKLYFSNLCNYLNCFLGLLRTNHPFELQEFNFEYRFVKVFICAVHKNSLIHAVFV